jgi:transposase
MKMSLTQLMNLPGVIGEVSKQTKETLTLFLKSDRKTAVCPRCRKTSHHIPQNKGHLFKDLPMGNREVILTVNRRGFKCETCQNDFSET